MAKFLNPPSKSAKNLFWFPIFLFLYSFTGNVSNDIYMPSMPSLVHIFNTSSHWIQMSLALWFLGAAAPQLLMDPLTDRYGRRRLLFVGGFIFLLSTLICAVSNYVGYLILARFFQGVSVCSLTVVSFIVIYELFSGHQCVRLLSLLNVCNSAAPLLGPLIGDFAAAMLGFSMTGFSSLGSFAISIVYNQTIASVAIVILIMSLIALTIYGSGRES